MFLLVWQPRVGAYFFYPVFIKMNKKNAPGVGSTKGGGRYGGNQSNKQTYLRLSLQIRTGSAGFMCSAITKLLKEHSNNVSKSEYCQAGRPGTQTP